MPVSIMKFTFLLILFALLISVLAHAETQVLKKFLVKSNPFAKDEHQDDTGTYGSLFYLYKHEHDITPVHISWIWLLVVPVAIILAGWLFKRFLIIAIILFIVFLYFNYHNGLSVPTFFESILNGLKHLF